MASHNLRLHSQNKRFHQLINQLGIDAGEKAYLISSLTNARTETSSLLTKDECDAGIKFLESKLPMQLGKQERCDRMRKKILSHCHTMQWYKRDAAGKLILKNSRPQLDYAHIDSFCSGPKSPFKKGLNEHNYKELVTLVSVFEELLKHDLSKV